MTDNSGHNRPAYDARARNPIAPSLDATPDPGVDASPTIRDLTAPRIRRNYTQGAKSEWRGEFTVESYHDPLTEEGIRAIADEDAEVAALVVDTLDELNRREDAGGS